jgi:uncharacterized membrane protein YeaQ/YmgE (transglycosylase-associated protein family)
VLEDIVRMGPMLILAGLIAGWTAEVVSRAKGYGFLPDMGLGLAGSLIAGWAAWLVVSGGAGMVVMFMVGFAGAALAIVAQRSVWRSARLGA